MPRNRIMSYLNIGQRSTELVFGNFSYLLFVGFLGIVYIANAHFAQRSVFEIQKLQKEIKALKWEYTSIKSETMYKSLQSQIDVGTDLELPDRGPKVINVK